MAEQPKPSRLSTDKIIQSFSGEGDVVAWIAKIELVAKLTNVADVSSFIPLYLEGGALALYLELPEAKKADAEALKKELIKAFTDGEVVSFCKLKGTRWGGEPVDVYANEIRRLAKGCGFKNDGLEQVVKLAFVAGFPDNISIELQSVQNFETIGVSELINRARVLTSNMGKGGLVAAGQSGISREQRLCYGCGGPHLVRNCPTRAKDLKCFRCGGNHLIRFCSHTANDTTRNVASVGTRLQTVGSQLRGVPVVQVMVNGRLVHALVDTGCTTTMVHDNLVNGATGEAVMVAFDGREVVCKGLALVNLQVGEKVISHEVTVVENMVKGVEVVLGMDVIGQLGGMKVKKGEIEFGTCAASGSKRFNPDIIDRDFEAYFDGKIWEVKYFWNDNGPPDLKNTVGEYSSSLPPEKMKSYEEEVERWIEEGILLPWYGEVRGVLPLIAVEQPTKGKVRPVLDFRDLNKGVKSHTGDDMTDVCGERLREWRMMEGEGEIVDLKSAYLQIRVAKELWKYQLVKFRGKIYCLTRLGFGLSSAPRIMTKILKTVLAERNDIKNATSSYIDDIMIDTSRVPTSEVVSHLEKNGLKAKQPETLEGGQC